MANTTKDSTPDAKPTNRRSRRAAAKRKPQNGGPPDTLGEPGRVQIVARKLNELQGQRFEIEVIMDANDAKPSDELPGAGGKTYKERMDELKEAEGRIAAKNKNLMKQVEGYLMALREGRQPG